MKKVFNSRPTLSTPNDRLQYVLVILIRVSLVAASVWAGFTGDWENLGMSLLAFGSTYVPTFLERQYRVYLPIEFHVVIVAFLYGSLFLGEVGQAYDRFWWWDDLLHLSSGVVLGFVGFLILYVLLVQKRLKMTPGLIAFFSFCVALAGGAVWEIIEFLIDQIFGANMQKSNLDTMKDLIIDAIGALGIVLAGQSYLKRAHYSPLSRMIDNFIALNPQLFNQKKRSKQD